MPPRLMRHVFDSLEHHLEQEADDTAAFAADGERLVSVEYSIGDAEDGYRSVPCPSRT